jgi:hypothetical protein
LLRPFVISPRQTFAMGFLTLGLGRPAILPSKRQGLPAFALAGLQVCLLLNTQSSLAATPNPGLLPAIPYVLAQARSNRNHRPDVTPQSPPRALLGEPVRNCTANYLASS